MKALVGREPRLGHDSEELRVESGIVEFARLAELGAVEARDRRVFQLAIFADQIAVLVDLDFQPRVDLVLLPFHAGRHVQELS